MESLKLRPEKWVQNGYTLAHHHDGRPIFLHGALPGEEVMARLLKETSSHLFALTTEVIEKSPERIDSDCSSFPECGGCSFRHLGYEAEKELKLQLLSEYKYIAALKQECQIEFFSDKRNSYRNHVQIQADGENFGFFAPHSNRVVSLPAQGCSLLSERLNQAIQNHSFAGRGKYTFRETEERIYEPPIGESGSSLRESLFITEELRPPESPPLPWEFAFNGFFQTNRFLWPRWLEYIDASLELLPAKLNVVELFAGSGVIGGYLSQRIGSYTGFESDRTALRAARNNFRRNGLSGEFKRFDLYRHVPQLSGKTDLIICNPPRSGIKQQLLDGIIAADRPALLYSSCSSATLNRDLKVLLAAGYLARRLALFDFFPGTPHLETVVLLSVTE